MTREAELLIDMWNILHEECHKVVTERNYDVIKKAIKALEQEPKEGHWIPMGIVDENGNRNYECSKCHHSDVQAASMTVPYCWFCGARMR